MFQAYAEVLGRHAADVVRRMSGLRPNHIDMISNPGSISQESYHLSVFVNFRGTLHQKPVSGYFVFGFAKEEDARPLARSVARHLGLEDTLADDPQGLINILSELLNIIIGLTGAGWDKADLQMDFGPPEVYVGRAHPPVAPGAKTYQITLEAKGYPDMNIAIRFIPGN